MTCNNCNKTIDADSKFCQFCGHKIEETTSKKEDSLWQAFVELSFEADKEKRQTSTLRVLVQRRIHGRAKPKPGSVSGPHSQLY